MYQLFSSINVIKRNVNPKFYGITNSGILIRLSKTQGIDETGIFQRNIDRGGQSKVRYIQQGITGNWISIPYGDTELLLSVPNPLEPYDLEFVPSYYSWDYTIEIHIPIPNPQYQPLIDRWGLSVGQLQILPPQVLDILMVLDPSKSADTRNMILQIESSAAAAAAADSKATVADAKVEAANVKLASVETSMIEQRDYSLEAANFLAEGDFMVAAVNHDLINAKPQLSLLDAEGDEQGFAQLRSVGVDTVKVELTQNQFANGSFPLALTLQGKADRSIVVGGWKPQPMSDRFYRLLNQTVDRSADGSTVENAALLSEVVEAFMSGTNQNVYYLSQLGEYGYLDNGNLGAGLTVITEAEYLAAKSSAGVVIL